MSTLRDRVDALAVAVAMEAEVVTEDYWVQFVEAARVLRELSAALEEMGE